MDSHGNTVPAVSIRIFLLIENRLLRESLVRLLRKRPDLTVVGHSSLSDSPPGLLTGLPCDVLLLDRFPVTSSAQIWPFPEEQAGVRPKIVLIGMDEDEGQFLSAVRSGVAGYLLKDASASDVVSVLRAVAQGEAVCPPRLCMSLFRALSCDAHEHLAASAIPKAGLTLRQRQLVSLVAKGLTNKEIASHLNLSEFTVKNHLHRIMKQVDAGSRHEAVETILAFSATPGH